MRSHSPVSHDVTVRRDGLPDGEPLEHDPQGRGRDARTPAQLGKRGMRDVLMRVKRQVVSDNLTVVAGGVAFFAFLAIFPAIAALISVWAMFADPATLEAQIEALMAIMPPGAAGLLGNQMREVASTSSSTLGWSAGLGILLSLWSANKGMSSMMRALNIAYNEEESRGFVKRTAVSLALTASAVLGVLVALAMVVAVPIVLGFVNLGGGWVETALNWARWPLLALFVLGSLSVLYHFGPSRSRPKWSWVSPGALLATVLWLAVSAAFSYYVANFGSYNKTYGSVGAVVAMLMWFYVSAWVILLGAELNSEMEHQTTHDTTIDPEQPMGRRGAYVADTLGEAH